ncbi:hypothetical protein PENTCL1PPCAC_27665, partial [Pristionchus entomophagus]
QPLDSSLSLFLLSSAMAIHLSLLLLSSIALFGTVHSLTCYVNDDEGNLRTQSNADWKYCGFIPFGSLNGGPRASGIGAATENLRGYESLFGQNSILYQVLATCILEKYDFSKINSNLGAEPEFMFRCVCSTNGCNKPTTFAKFLAAQKH